MFRDILAERWLNACRQAAEIVQAHRKQLPAGVEMYGSFAAVGISLAAASLGTGIAGAVSAAGAQSEANKTNQDIANATNALNYQMFLQGRGSEGSAILPMYFADQGAEKNIANQAYAKYLAQQAALGTPSDEIRAYRNYIAGMEPSMAAGDALVNQLFSGELADQQVANMLPIYQARAGVAATQKQGILEGLSTRLNALAADRARAGYTGGGSAFQRNALTGAAIPALQQAASVGAQADLQNATDTANIRNAAIQTRLQNLSLPLTQAANRIQLTQLPGAAASQSFATALQPFNFFRISPAAYQAERPPLVSPVPNTGQIVGQGLSSLASSLGNYYMMRSLIGQMNQTGAGSGVNPASSGLTVGQLMQNPAGYTPWPTPP